ncbi:hypothetical protein AJ80_06743 [Polytolypa hystricis UAMH7299]|uniref:Phosphatidylinositol-specific phospholipase C X domain-containing protein n=1 Tax=Polytolypa hystricis (strain UAMH7299) TaxID=1447883 RepID=A0A2B7XU88_POLH7|nr:hypothetical protein AJ80_06743 [Polytolypa hystricis UAMH7299]
MKLDIRLFAVLYLLDAFSTEAQTQKSLTSTRTHALTPFSPQEQLPTNSTGHAASLESTAHLTPTTRCREEHECTAATEGVLITISDNYMLLVGNRETSSLTLSLPANETILSGNTTASSTASIPTPTNTRPCNGYPELCQRKYANITHIGAHNSPFVRPGNVASNQQLPVSVQLDDGIRMLQFQAHYVNDTIYLCHTSCDLLNAGTLEDYLTKVVDWLRVNPYDVLTILIGNVNYIAPGNYIAPIKASGLLDYAYIPPKTPMELNDWPMLSEFILSGHRAIVFMDYKANQTEVPYILDEFTNMWETPFSPTDRDFPCPLHRPPGSTDVEARKKMYIANHNLNTEINIAGKSILVPNIALLNETNAVSGFGSLGKMAADCTELWGRPPNFLLVDYYNIGGVNGSVFRVAAASNGVTYKGKCCHEYASSAAESFMMISRSLSTYFSWYIFIVVLLMKLFGEPTSFGFFSLHYVLAAVG